MGATLKQRDVDIDQSTQMDKLFIWIRQMRIKKMKWLLNRQRCIRVEAVLAHALSHAEQQLRDKQIARIQRWQQMRAEILHKENTKDNNSDIDSKSSDSFYPELSSFDSFMSDVNKIKTPLER